MKAKSLAQNAISELDYSHVGNACSNFRLAIEILERHQ